MSLPVLDILLPTKDPLIDDARLMGANWIRWMSQLLARVLVTVGKPATPVHRTGLSVSIVATTLFTPATPGDYRVNWYAQVTQAATTNSSLTVTIGWTANSVACTKTFAPASLTTNTTASCDGDSVTIRPDSGQAVTYATAYTSTGATPMQYMLDVYPEQLPV